MNPSKPKLVDKSTAAEGQPSSVEQGADPLATPVQLSEWMADPQLSIFVLLSLTIGAGYLTYRIFRPFLIALFIALIMAIAFFPIHKWIVRRVRYRSVAAFITTVLAVLVVVVPFIVVSARIAAEAVNVYRSVLQPMGDTATWLGRFDLLIEKAANQTGLPVDQLRADVVVRVRIFGAWLVGLASSLGGRFIQQIVTASLAFVFLFSILRDCDELRVGAISMLPLTPNRARELAIAVNEGVIADIYGVFIVGVAEGLLIALGFWFAGLRSPLLWGSIAAVLSCLPYVGVFLVWMPACVVLALRENWISAILLFAWCSVVVSIAEGIVRSNVVSGRVNESPFLITLSIMGGLAEFGPIGIFVGPVVIVVIARLIRILREEHATVYESRRRAA
jgi:predicted PurR-regulated permease PerM